MHINTISIFVLLSMGLSPIYADVMTHGLYASSDNGRTWQCNRKIQGIEDHPIKQTGEDRAKYVLLRKFYENDYGGSDVQSFGDVDEDCQQEMYIGYYHFDMKAILQHEFDDSLNYVIDSVLPYGIPWILTDLNDDNYLELLVQRGDAGLSGNGYLDVYRWSGTDFIFLQRLTFPEMKMSFHPTAYDLNSDGLMEVILTTAITLTPYAYVRIAIWDPIGDSLRLEYSHYLYGAYGIIGTDDFDDDGNGEFVIGNYKSIPYSRFESENNIIYYKGSIGEHSGTFASSWDIEGNGHVRLILGCNQGSLWRYEIFRAIDNDHFEIDTVLEMSTNYYGSEKGGVGDTDNDGREEALLKFYPYAILYEWIDEEIAQTWILDQTKETGTIMPLKYPNWDINDDGFREWIFPDHRDTFHIYGLNQQSPYYVGRPECYNPGQSIGYFIWYDTEFKKWFSCWSSDEVERDFTGIICYEGNLDGFEKDIEHEDNLTIGQWTGGGSNKNHVSLQFDAKEQQGEDRLIFKSNKVNFNLKINHLVDLDKVFIGRYGLHPDTMPFSFSLGNWMVEDTMLVQDIKHGNNDPQEH